VRRPSRKSKRPLGDLSTPRDADEESRDLDLCYVAAGRLDGCYEQGFSAWDVAAGVLILREAGGEATDYQGGELDFEDKGLVASNGVLHPSLVGVTSAAAANVDLIVASDSPPTSSSRVHAAACARRAGVL
jgi:3'-phosphoadenosine 5'-phosphosulfate (PAPS) 3'-phosphatase